MTNNNLKWLLAIAIIALVLLGFTYYNSRGDYDILAQKYTHIQQDYDLLNSQYSSTQAETSEMKDTLATLQGQIQTLDSRLQQRDISLQQKDNELNQLQGQVNNLKTQLKLFQDSGIEVFQNTQPPYAKASYAPVHLINNPYATKPTWSQLLSFLSLDITEKTPYASCCYICGDFAERLHNNAEVAGIQSAWVYIGLANEPDGHALNAFNTVDRGLVYIDDTGVSPSYLYSYNPVTKTTSHIETSPKDKLAYIQVGKEAGAITIGQTLTSNYAEYTDASRALDAYNSQVEAYNNYIHGKIFYEGTAEASLADQWYNRLIEMEKTLKEVWEPMGIVTGVEIYW